MANASIFAAFERMWQHIGLALSDKADKSVNGKSVLYEIKTTSNEGLKITNNNQIDIDNDIVFILDCDSET
jgi:hypothetical protein